MTRAELDDVEALLDRSGVATVEATAALAERLAAVEQALSENGGASADALRADVEAVRKAIRALRGDVRRELAVVAARLEWLEARLSGPTGLGNTDEGTLSEDEEKELAIQARDPDDAGVRFSALVLLGRTRTSRSVQASREGLDDVRDFVVWQALRNLGRFRERAAAVDIARRLDHESAVVRAAAADALVAMGAPETGYDPSAQATARAGAARKLRAWAVEQQ